MKQTNGHYDIDNTWIEALLQRSSIHDGSLSVYEQLKAAYSEFEQSVSEAQAMLDNHPLREAVIVALMNELGLTGPATIEVNNKGQVKLVVGPGSGKTKKHTLPPIDVLRTQAQELGIDISSMGRSKKKILAAIEEKRQMSQQTNVRTAPALTPATVQNTDTGLKAADIFRRPEVE